MPDCSSCPNREHHGRPAGSQCLACVGLRRLHPPPAPCTTGNGGPLNVCCSAPAPRWTGAAGEFRRGFRTFRGPDAPRPAMKTVRFPASRSLHDVWGSIWRQIDSWPRAQQLLRQGHTDLDRDGDGEACEFYAAVEAGIHPITALHDGLHGNSLWSFNIHNLWTCSLEPFCSPRSRRWVMLDAKGVSLAEGSSTATCSSVRPTPRSWACSPRGIRDQARPHADPSAAAWRQRRGGVILYQWKRLSGCRLPLTHRRVYS